LLSLSNVEISLEASVNDTETTFSNDQEKGNPPKVTPSGENTKQFDVAARNSSKTELKSTETTVSVGTLRSEHSEKSNMLLAQDKCAASTNTAELPGLIITSNSTEPQGLVKEKNVE
jgi:hypothetical protein